MPARNDGNDERKRAAAKGRPARIDRNAIIEAARGLSPEKVTMNAVAKRLGVDPTALNYHVGGRREFLKLVAEDRARLFIEEEFAIDPSGSWQDQLYAYATALRRTLVRVGPLCDHLQFEAATFAAFLKPVERLLSDMTAAGFGVVTAARGLAAVAHMAGSVARHDIKTRAEANRKRAVSSVPVYPMLAGPEGERFPQIRALFCEEHEDGFGTADSPDRQFDFAIRTIIAGLDTQFADSMSS